MKNTNNFIKNFAKAGADIITIHPEATNNLTSSIKKIKSYNIKAGVSLNPETSVDKVLDILNLIDLILIMSVNPGFAGQKFMEETLEKVKILRKEIDIKKLKKDLDKLGNWIADVDEDLKTVADLVDRLSAK